MKDVLARIDQSVARRPDHCAITACRGALSYAELGRAADGLAATLAALGHPAGSCIGHLGASDERRWVTLLATQRAGLALAALDPSHPQAALADLVAHSGLVRLLADPEHMALAEALAPGRCMAVPVPLDPGPETAPFARTEPGEMTLSHLRYTSGTTGRPKGVPISRYAAGQQALIKGGLIGLTQDDRLAPLGQFWPIDVLACWEQGASVHCFDFAGLGPLALCDWMRDQRITALSTYPALFRQMIDAATGPLPDLVKIYLVGEPLRRADLEAFERICPAGARLSIGYGSNECINVCVHHHIHGDPIRSDTVPLGRPVRPGMIRLLDAEGRDAPPGEPGEITVTARLIPKGYHNDPERSRGVFEPAEDGSGNWRYNSGDFAYADREGVLHFAGRRDEQVKIRGYTLRPSDIEQALLTHPSVAMAAVVAFEGRKGIRRLACHYVPAEGAAAEPAALKAHLAARMPNYMVPSVFMAHASLPVTGTGKIRRRALPDPLAGRRREAAAAPAGPTETRLAEIWQDVLGHREFGRDEDFFDIGGDSLQAMSMVIEAERAFGVRVPFEGLILEGAGLADVAARIEAQHREGMAREIVTLRRGAGGPPLFAMPVAGGHLSSYLELVHAFEGDRTVVGVHARGMDRQSRPDADVEAMGAHAAEAILRHRPEGPVHLMGYSNGAFVAMEAARSLAAQGQRIAALILLDPNLGVTRLRRHARAVRYPWRDGARGLALRRLGLVLAGGLGLGAGQRSMDDTHLLAMARYRARPLPLPRVLVVQALDNRDRVRAAAQARALFGAGLTISELAGAHQTVMRPPLVGALANAVEAWLEG